MLLTHAAVHEGFDATHIPSYGPESRGGTSYADVRIAAGEVLSPAVARPRSLVVFNEPSAMKFGPRVLPGGVMLYDSAMVRELPPLAPGVRAVGVPFSKIATELGRPLIKNVVALGALQAATGIFPEETFLTVIREALARKSDLLPLNEEAFRRGAAAVSA
jgi:Pyruvate/2-oxoacid:ferredoxin oxidoreductase gamma subunit